MCIAHEECRDFKGVERALERKGTHVYETYNP